MNDKKTSQIMLIEARNGFVKFFAASAPEHYARLVCSSSPVPTRLLAVWAGTQRDVIALRRRFAEFQRHSCWLLCEGELKDFVKTKTGHGVATVLGWEEPLLNSAQARKLAGFKKRSATWKKKSLMRLAA